MTLVRAAEASHARTQGALTLRNQRRSLPSTATLVTTKSHVTSYRSPRLFVADQSNGMSGGRVLSSAGGTSQSFLSVRTSAS